MIEPKEDQIYTGYYKHYKGGVYKVIGFAKHSETKEELVIYANMDGGETWARPRSMWNEIVEHNNKKVKRFIFQN